MDQSLEETNIKNELTDSTSSDRLEISTEMQVKNVKQESECLIQSEIGIKTEPQEDENEFPVSASTSYDMCSNYDIKIEADEPMIKIECEDLVDEIMQDPLDIGSEIKVEEYIPIGLDQSESGIKIEPSEFEKDKTLLKTDKETDSQGSSSNYSQEQLLIRNDPDCKYKNHICNECNKAFRWKSLLDRHIRIHTGEKPYTCNVCKKLFTVKSNLDIHMLIHIGEKPHVCDVCSKVFRHKSALNEHKLIHSVGKKPFSCNICNKSFTQKTHLVVHKRTHTGEKPFACDKCDKAFTDKSNLNQHRRLHTGEKPFCCNICNESFAQNAGLYQHKRVHKH